MKWILILATLTLLPPLAHSQAIPFEQTPAISVTGSGMYLYGERENNLNNSLRGWTITPEINLTHRFGMQTEVSYLLENTTPAQRRLLVLGGPRYNFVPMHGVRPYIFAEAGEMRLTSPLILTDWDPIAQVGFGFDRRMWRNISLTIVPAEYLAHNLDAGGWTSAYAARVGITINFYPKLRQK